MAKLTHFVRSRLRLLVAAVFLGIFLEVIVFMIFVGVASDTGVLGLVALLGNAALLFVSLPAFALLWWFRTMDTFNSNDASELSVYVPLLVHADVNVRASGLAQIALLKKRKPHLEEQIDSATANINLEDENKVQLVRANLSEVNLERANLTNVELTEANLTKANLTEANLTDTVLTDAKLKGAVLTKANLTKASLIGLDLTGAILTDANLTEANLTGADLTNADLRGADLTGVKLNGAVHSVDTKFPSDLFDPKAAGMVLRNK